MNTNTKSTHRMKPTKYIVILAAAIVVTSCGTTPPKAIPVDESNLVGGIINGLQQGRALIRESGGFVQDVQRFPRL